MTAVNAVDGANAVDTPVAERPLVRELAEWRLFLPFTGRVLALQGAHPTVAKGIYDHSDVFADPFGRARRTMDYAQRLMFGPDRAATAHELRELHRDIKGTGFDGRPYHAWNREAWTWVHLTTFEATLYALRAIHGPVPRAQQEALYRDVKAVGVLYGVRADDMPADIASLKTYIHEGIETKLTHRPDIRLLRRMAKPRRLPIPNSAWRVLWRAAGHPSDVMLFGSFPPVIRRRWGVRWTRLHELEHRAQLAALRTASAPLPDRLRMLPYAYRALHNSSS